MLEAVHVVLGGYRAVMCVELVDMARRIANRELL